MILDLVEQVRERMLTRTRLSQWDCDKVFPEEEIRELLGPEIGLQLLFIPEEYGGMGGGARDIAAFSELMAKICLGVGTGFLAIHLGADPILVGATDEQKQKWLTRLAEQGAIVAYAVTEPEAGSNLSSLKTTATPVLDDGGDVTGYRITGNKQFISNAGYADFMTVLAQTPEGPSFFIVEKGAEGLTAGKPEDKHGIRSSNTAALTFDEVFVPVEALSYGERARLVLARLVATGCNFLMLDEPINHLDIPSRAKFEQAMRAFEGTVLAVVHDRYFIRRFATRVWALQDGTLRNYVDLDQLRQARGAIHRTQINADSR